MQTGGNMLFSFVGGGDNGTYRSILYYRLESQKNKINRHFLCCLLASIYLIFDMNIYVLPVFLLSNQWGGET
jgi:hypothetical protein